MAQNSNPAELKSAALSVAEEARKTAETQIASQKGRVAEGLGTLAQALRVGTSAPKHQLSAEVRPYMTYAADQVEQAAWYFGHRSLKEMAQDFETFARREPALFLGGAFATGLFGGRFLKATKHKSPGSTGLAEGQPARGTSGSAEGGSAPERPTSASSERVKGSDDSSRTPHSAGEEGGARPQES